MDLRIELGLEFARKYHEYSFERYAGLDNILRKLFDQGQVLTTIEPSTSGGIFTFISCSTAKESVGCYFWSFNSEFWKWSEFTSFIELEKEIVSNQIKEKRKEIRELNDRITEINRLTAS